MKITKDFKSPEDWILKLIDNLKETVKKQGVKSWSVSESSSSFSVSVEYEISLK